jgi:hypothetical protein
MTMTRTAGSEREEEMDDEYLILVLDVAPDSEVESELRGWG